MEQKYKHSTFEEEQELEQNGSGDNDDGSDAIRDPGVSDEIWQELELAKKEEENWRRTDQEKAIQEHLRQWGPCPAGYKWHKVGGGWRCSAGGHFVSDEQLRSQFTFDGWN